MGGHAERGLSMLPLLRGEVMATILTTLAETGKGWPLIAVVFLIGAAIAGSFAWLAKTFGNWCVGLLAAVIGLAFHLAWGLLCVALVIESVVRGKVVR